MDSDIKDVRTFFDKSLYLPWPGYSSRMRIWQTLIEKRLSNGNVPDDFDISTLARISEGYSGRSIAYAVKSVLSERRKQTPATEKLEVSEFLVPLSRCPQTYEEDHLK